MLQLPKNDEDLARILEECVGRAQGNMGPWLVLWQVNWNHINGNHNYSVLDWNTGRVRVNHETSQGQMEFRLDDVVKQYNRDLGQMLGIDIMPKATPKRMMELDGARKSAVAQAYLESKANQLQLEKLKLDLLEGLRVYGTMGVGVWFDPAVSLGDSSCKIETIPPWQLVPYPDKLTRAADRRGLMRVRYVPYLPLRDRLKAKDFKLPRADSPSNMDESLEVLWMPHGTAPSEMNEVQATGQSGAVMAAGHNPGQFMSIYDNLRNKKGSDLDEPFVKLVEFWADNPDGQLTNSVTMVGRHIANRAEFNNSKVYMPVAVARCLHTSGFYGWPWVSLLIPSTVENEKMFAQLFKNVRELDQFGFLVVPDNRNIKRQHFESKARPRVIFASPDITGMQAKVEHIVPFNTGDAPGRVAMTGLQLADRLSDNSPLYHGEVPGRLESGVALGLVYETGNLSRRPELASIDHAMTTVYRSILAYGAATDKRAFSLASIDDMVAGVQLSPEGMVELSSNPLPMPDEVTLSIRGREPRLKTQRRQELMLMLDKGAIDLKEFVWKSYIEGAEYPTGHDDWIEQFKVGMWRNIIMFNDGQTPKGVKAFEFDDHDIQLRVLGRFMKSVLFQLASPEVQTTFKKRMDWHQQQMGGPTPNAMSYPEEVAGMSIPDNLPPILQKEAMRLQQKAMGGPGGGGPPPGMPGMGM